MKTLFYYLKETVASFFAKAEVKQAVRKIVVTSVKAPPNLSAVTPIASPSTATATDVATAYNNLLAALKA